jgi:hypothetical protein
MRNVWPFFYYHVRQANVTLRPRPLSLKIVSRIVLTYLWLSKYPEFDIEPTCIRKRATIGHIWPALHTSAVTA